MQARLDAGENPHFLPETRRIRESDWKVRLSGGSGFINSLKRFQESRLAGMTALMQSQE